MWKIVLLKFPSARNDIVRQSVHLSHPFRPFPIILFSRNFQDILVLSNRASRLYGLGRPTKVKVAGVNQTVTTSILCAFPWTPPRVSVRLSSKLGKMCQINLQKNVGRWNFDFLTRSIFSWGQILIKSNNSKTCYFFAIQFSPAFHLVRIRTQLFCIFNLNSKIFIFGQMTAKTCDNSC